MVAYKKRSLKAVSENRQEGDDTGTHKAGEISLKPAFKTLALRVIAIIIYMCLGALVFCAIEYRNYDRTQWNRQTSIMRLRFKEKYNISDQELTMYETAVQTMFIKEKASHHEWTYYQSLYFVSTVTTTIGYGHLTPETQAGRLFLIVFAVFGIPLNILALATVGEHITIGICLGISRLSRMCCKKRTVRHINIKVMIVSITLMVFMLFVGGSLYVTTEEEWTYIDSIYYCFVALATIGFGDLVPNDGRPPNTSFGKALWGLRVLYISIGLSLVSTVFTAISNAIEEINALLGWPKQEDEEDVRKRSRLEGDVPGLKGRAMRLPNHLTYRSTVDEMHDNLASALPIPGFRLGSGVSGNDQAAISRHFGETSAFGVGMDHASVTENLSSNENIRRSQSLRKNRNLNGRVSSISLNSKDSAEVAVDYELRDNTTILEVNERDDEDGSHINLPNGTAIGTTIRLSDISTQSYVRNISCRPTFSRDVKSIHSSENDGYESSYHAYSEKSYSYPERRISCKSHRFPDIQEQISDFAHCSPRKRQDVYREGHLPPEYHEHIRNKINNDPGYKDDIYTDLKLNGVCNSHKRKSSVDIEQYTRHNYGNREGKPRRK